MKVAGLSYTKGGPNGLLHTGRRRFESVCCAQLLQCNPVNHRLQAPQSRSLIAHLATRAARLFTHACRWQMPPSRSSACCTSCSQCSVYAS